MVIKKIFMLALAFIMAFQMVAFAECSINVDEKTVSGAKVSISGAEVATAVGIWVDFDNSGKMITYKPVDITFVDGAATANYTGSFINLKFMIVKDTDNIMPLCDAADIVLDDIIFKQPDGIEDLGDIEDL